MNVFENRAYKLLVNLQYFILLFEAILVFIYKIFINIPLISNFYLTVVGLGMVCLLITIKYNVTIGKVYFCILNNISILFLSIVFGKGAGMELFFFSMMLGALFLFSQKDKFLRNALLSLPAILLISLHIVDYDAFLHIHIKGLEENKLLNTSSLIFGLITTLIGMVQFVTLRDESESELEKSKINLKSIFQNTTYSLIFIDKELRILDFNAKTLQSAQFSKKNIQHGTSFLNYISLDRQENYLDIFRRCLHGENVRIEECFDGIFIESHFSPVITEENYLIGILLSSHDISEQKNSQKAIKDSELFLRSIFDNLPIGIQIFNTEGISERMNEAQKYLVGIETKKYGAGRFNILKDQFNISMGLSEIFKQVYQGKTILNKELVLDFSSEFNTWATRKDAIRINLSALPIYNSNNELVAAIGITEDITERKRTEMELIQSKIKAEQAVMAKSLFLSTMTHEIRTPMNAIIGLTSIMMEEEPRDDQMENLKALKFSSENLLYLINDILDFSKIEAGKMEFENIAFNLHEMLRNIWFSFNKKATQKNLDFKMVISDDIPNIVIGDSLRLNQVITNLISNAIKFTTEGFILLEVKSLERSEDVCKTRFIVQDSGVGIPPEKFKSIFESFTQATTSTSRQFGGSGLGLTITKKILELQGSDIHVKSKVKEGSTFHFDLEFKISKNKIEPSFHQPSKIKQDLSGVRILLAEDNKLNIMVAQKILTKWGATIDIAENGFSTLELMKHNTYDLILMDIQMPDIDGFKVTRSIRKYNSGDIPIIAVTASATSDVRQQALDAGMNDFITKPFNINDLYTKIIKYCKPELID